MDFKIESRTGAYLFLAIGATFIFACIYMTVRDGSASAMFGLLAIAGGLCMGKGFTIFRHLSDREKGSGNASRGKGGKTDGNPAGLNRAQRRRNRKR